MQPVVSVHISSLVSVVANGGIPGVDVINPPKKLTKGPTKKNWCVMPVMLTVTSMGNPPGRPLNPKLLLRA